MLVHWIALRPVYQRNSRQYDRSRHQRHDAHRFAREEPSYENGDYRIHIGVRSIAGRRTNLVQPRECRERDQGSEDS